MTKDYSNGKIYFIQDRLTEEIYFGSTTRSLKIRLQNHEAAYQQYLKGNYKYNSVYDILKNGNYYIALIEYFPCDTKEELHKREGEYQKYSPCVNKYIAGRDKKEREVRYYQKNKQKIIDYAKDRYRRKSEEIKEYQRQRYQKVKWKYLEKVTCNCGCQVSRKQLNYHLQTKKHNKLISSC